MRTTIAILLATLACGCSIEKITEPWPESPPYGEIVREIRLEGNGYLLGTSRKGGTWCLPERKGGEGIEPPKT